MDKVCDDCKRGKIRGIAARVGKSLRQGHFKCAKNSLKMGASVNTKVLILAAERGDLVSVKKCIKTGVNV